MFWNQKCAGSLFFQPWHQKPDLIYSELFTAQAQRQLFTQSKRKH